MNCRPLNHPPILVCVVAAGFAATAAATEPLSLAESLSTEDPAALVAAIEQEGNALRGANVFHARQLACTQCHTVGM